jgi:GT2 family glycosyltransferase
MKIASVIIPCYGAVDQVRHCLEGVFRQTCGRDQLEIIIVNNGDPSDYATLEAEFPFVVWLHEAKPGSYAARNTGLKRATTETIAFTDSDCEVSEGWIEEGLKALDTSTAAIAAGDTRYSGPTGRRLNVWESLEEVFFMQHRQRFLVEKLGVAACANLFVRRSAFDQVGLFDTDLMSFGDGDWVRRAVRQGAKLIFAAEAVVYHPRRESFAAMNAKVRRLAGDKIVELRKRGVGGLGLFREVFRSSPVDPKLYAGLFVAGKKAGMLSLLARLPRVLMLPAGAMVEKVRVICGGRSFRGPKTSLASQIGAPGASN